MRKRRSREEATGVGSVPTAARRSPHRGRDVRGYVGTVAGPVPPHLRMAETFRKSALDHLSAQFVHML